MRKEIEQLLASDISGYAIYKATGVSQSRISDLRKGNTSLDNTAFKIAEKLYDYAVENLSSVNGKTKM